MSMSGSNENGSSSDPAGSNRSPNLQVNRNVTVVKMIGKRLYINGFMYTRNSTDTNNKVTWECRRYRKHKCLGRATTSDPNISENIVLYRGLKESPHNHEPSPQEVKEAEEAAKVGKRVNREHQVVSPSPTNYGPDSKSRTQLGIEFQSPETSRTAVKVEKNEPPPELKSKRPARSTAKQSAYDFGLSYDLSPMPPSLIGNKLNIDGFIYDKNNSYMSDGHIPKTRWLCSWSKTGKCFAKAVTSDPSLSQDLIIYKGPDESNHNHSQSHAEVEEAQEAACNIGESHLKSDTANVGANPVDAPPLSDDVSKLAESGRVSTAENPDQMQLTAGQETLVPADPNNDNAHHQMQVKLIGKCLCIEGYVYTKHSNGQGVNWVCRRYRKTGCIAKVSTSDPFVGEELAIYKIDGLSRHNHSPCELEVEEAELRAKLDLNRLKRRDLEEAQSHNGLNGVDTEDLHQKSRTLDMNEKCAITTDSEENRPPYPKAIKRSASTLPLEANKIAKSIRLIGARLCIDGYMYVKSSRWSNRIMWECKRYRNSGCPGRASTSDTTSIEELVVYKGLDESEHNHSPSPTEVAEAEDWARARKKFRRSKSKRGSGKVKPEVSLRQINHHQSLSSASAEKVEACDASSQNQPQHSEALGASNMSPVPRNGIKLKKHYGLLQDTGMYRKFLVKFLDKPVFNKQSMVEALQAIYSSNQGCLMACPTVLKFQKKIEQDLEILKNNPNATITTALDSESLAASQNGSSEADNNVQRDSKYGPTAPNTPSSTVVVQDPSAAETTCNAEAALSVSDTCAPSIQMLPPTQNPKPQELSSHHQEKEVGTIPPVPAAVAMKKILNSESSSPLSSHDKPKMKRKIICIDQSDESDEPPKVRRELGDVSAETSSQSKQTDELVSAPGSLTSLLKDRGPNFIESMEAVFNPAFLHGIRYYGPVQQSDRSQLFIQPNLPNAGYNPAMCNPFNYSTNSINLNSSCMVNDIQVPVMMQNIPNMMNNAAINAQRLFAQFQVPHQPNMN